MNVFPGDLFEVRWTFPEDGDDYLSFGELTSVPEEWLPQPDARLRIPTQTVESFDADELSRLRAATQRTVASVELEAPGLTTTEFPLRGVGRISNALQVSLDALAQEEDGRRTSAGRLPQDVVDEIQMSVIGLRAASFVILVAADKRGRLIENEDIVAAVFDRLTTLISTGASEDDEAFLEVLRGYGPSARGRYKDLLKRLADYGTGVAVEAAPLASTDRFGATMSPVQVRRSLDVMSAVQPTRHTLVLKRATLTALNTTRRTFEVVDNVSTFRYSGQVAPEARSQADGLRVGQTSYVRVTLEVELDFAASEDEANGDRKYTLTAIEQVEDQ